MALRIDAGGSPVARAAIPPAPRRSVAGWLRQDRARNFGLGLAATVGLVALWQIATSTGLLSAQVIPPPVDVVRAWVKGMGIGAPTAPLLKDLESTLIRVVVGVVSGAVIGLILAVVAGIWAPVRQFFEPIMALLNVIPAVVTLPVISLWTGVGGETIVIVTAYSTVIPIYRGATAELALMDEKLVWAARSLGAAGVRYIASVVAPLSMLGALKNGRVALGYAWRATIAAEILVVARTGLGALTFDAHQYGNIATMLAAIITALLLGLVLDGGALALQSRMLERRGLISR